MPAFVPVRVPTTKARSAKMKSIGEISIAPLPGGISGILDAQGAGKRQPQEPQHSGPKGRRDRLPPHGAHPLHAAETETPKRQKRPFSTKLRKTLRRYVGARVPPLGCARLFGSLRPRARRLTALRLENGPQYRRMDSTMAKVHAAPHLGQGRGERGVGLWGTPRR